MDHSTPILSSQAATFTATHQQGLHTSDWSMSAASCMLCLWCDLGGRTRCSRSIVPSEHRRMGNVKRKIEQVFFKSKKAYLTYLPTLCRGYGCMCMVKELFKRAARSGTPT